MNKYDGLDFTFEFDEDTYVSTLRVITNHTIQTTSGSGAWVELYTASGYTDITIGNAFESLIEKYRYPYSTFNSFRILMHQNFITVYIDNNWAHTFSVPYVDYAYPGHISINDGGDYRLGLMMELVELHDWREAIFVDIESSPSAAVGTIIQERPVEMIGRKDGSISFFYTPDVRTPITLSANFLRKHEQGYGGSAQAASDTIVYFSNVGVNIDTQAFKDLGFSTRILRIPNIDNGAMTVSSRMSTKARQQREMHNIETRFDPRLEMDDQVNLSYDVPGSGRHVEESFIVESLQYGIAAGRNEMSVSGRSASETYSPFPRNA